MDTTQNVLEEIERVSATCQTCGKNFQAGVMRSPFDSSKILLQARHCDPCILTIRKADEERQRTADAESRRSARLERWGQLCPMDFRTTAEGGRTDVDRLFREHPAARRVAEHRLANGRGLIVRGPSGTAKTRATWRMLRIAFDAGKSMQAFTAGRFDREARDAGGNFTLSAWVERLIKTDVLFIDDIGKAPWTPATVGLWFEVLDARCSEARPVVLTTNLDGAGLCAQLRIGPDIGEPMLRRLRENCDSVVLK